MDFLELCRSRYSERRFGSKEVEAEKLEKILEAGRIAPTAHNNQPQRIFVVQSKEALEKIRAATPMTFNAPVVLVVGYDINEAWKITEDSCFPNHNSGEVDASIVMTMMMMEAESLGVKTCWVRAYDTQAIMDALDIPNHVRLVGILDAGYESEASHPAKLHTMRKNLSDIVIEK